MVHQWNFGDWGRVNAINEIVRYIGPNGDGGVVTWFLHREGSVLSRLIDGVTHLPDCDSFDW